MERTHTPALYIVAAGLLAIAFTLIMRTALGTVLLAEVVVDGSTGSLDPRGFSLLLETFGALGKPLLFTSVVVGQVCLYLIAWRLGERAGRADRPVLVAYRAAGIAIAGVLLATLFLVVTTPAALHETSWLEYGLIAVLAADVFAMVTVLLGQIETSGIEEAQSYVLAAPDAGRRSFLSQTLALGLGAVSLIVIGRRVIQSGGGGVQASTRGEPTPAVTPTKDFYIVSKNLLDPGVDIPRWRLRIGGATESLVEVTYDELLSDPTVEQYTTLQCISNEVGGSLMSNALWRGVRPSQLIERAKPSAAARYVLFRSEDNYSVSLPLDFVMGEGTLLAHEMNGEPLNHKHGAPLRLLAPGRYGFKHPKWITEMILTEDDRLGYWESRGWSRDGHMHTSCRIDVPAPFRTLAPGVNRIHGVAFSGDRGITRVEVSTDEGVTWQEAKLTPALSPYTWVLWYYDWDVPNRNARYEIQARATDGTGAVQTSEKNPPYPDGATGYPNVTVNVNRMEKGPT